MASQGDLPGPRCLPLFAILLMGSALATSHSRTPAVMKTRAGAPSRVETPSLLFGASSRCQPLDFSFGEKPEGDLGRTSLILARSNTFPNPPNLVGTCTGRYWKGPRLPFNVLHLTRVLQDSMILRVCMTRTSNQTGTYRHKSTHAQCKHNSAQAKK